MDRRGFLGSILALGVAPAIVRADSLMRVIPWDTGVLLTEEAVVGVLAQADFEVGAYVSRMAYGTVRIRDGKVFIEEKAKVITQPGELVLQNATGPFMYPGDGRTPPLILPLTDAL